MTYRLAGRERSFIRLSNIPENGCKIASYVCVCVTERKRVFVGVWLACYCEKCASVGVKSVSQI